MTTYTLSCGDVVTSKDGEWPTQYANRTQAYKAAAKVNGATVIQRGRPFYVCLKLAHSITNDAVPVYVRERMLCNKCLALGSLAPCDEHGVHLLG
jgi:hypothetical protein